MQHMQGISIVANHRAGTADRSVRYVNHTGGGDGVQPERRGASALSTHFGVCVCVCVCGLNALNVMAY